MVSCRDVLKVDVIILITNKAVSSENPLNDLKNACCLHSLNKDENVFNIITILRHEKSFFILGRLLARKIVYYSQIAILPHN